MNKSAERIAKNDATFREANERIQRAARRLGVEPVQLDPRKEVAT